MAVYIFTLMAGYVFSGVDTAQGYRARMLAGVPYPVKYIFTEPLSRRDMIRYGKVGIRPEQMLGMHQYFTDNHELKPCGRAQEKLEELKERLRCTSVERRESEIWLIRGGEIAAALLLDEERKDLYYGVHYYKQARLVRTEIYTDGLAYVNYYVTAYSGGRAYAELTRRSFCNRDGEVVFDQLFAGEKEWYSFPDGAIYTKQQFLALFMERLQLTERDVILLDRPARFEFLQPVFQYKKRARLIVIMHSGHYFEKGEDPYDIFLNKEYNYCFKYADSIDTMVVSTQEQKEELADKLREYRCSVPKIAVIPAGGIDHVRYPEKRRRPGSILTVSRIERRKKIEWAIESTVKAHSANPDIFLDIYGRDDGYLPHLQGLVEKYQAQSYIRFMGWTDVTEVYKNYEVYLTASLWETLGLSLLEAVASGTALIGLDVKYGNRLFIRPGENGYLVDFCTDDVNGDDGELTDAMAERIIEIFADPERLERFHRKSYEIAEGFSAEIIADKWKRLLQFPIL